MGIIRLFRWLLGLDRSGKSLDSPRFQIKEGKISWECHVCHARREVPIQRKGTITTTCSECGTKRTITDGTLDPPGGIFSKKRKIVFVTRATLKELRAKNNSQEEEDIKVRERLVYHEDYDCAFAHKDYEIDGVLFAYNTGVVEAKYKSDLELCKACAGVEFEPCDRCRGKGYIPRFSHVQNGICFKCQGQGYLEKYPEKED